jgi:hypothetical protein
MRVLGESVEPMRMMDIHAEVERVLGRSVSRSAVKNWLAGHTGGETALIVRIERGRYVMAAGHRSQLDSALAPIALDDVKVRGDRTRIPLSGSFGTSSNLERLLEQMLEALMDPSGRRPNTQQRVEALRQALLEAVHKSGPIS